DSQPVNQNYNTASYNPGGAGWYDLWGRNIDGLTNGLFDAPQASGGTVSDIQSIGTDFPSAGWLGDAIAGMAEGRGVGWENPTTGSLHNNAPTDVTQDMTKVGVDFNQMPQSIRDNISGLINPTGQQIAAMHDKAAQGQQYAHKGVSPNSFHHSVDKLLGVEGTLPPDASKDNAFKKAVDSGAGKVADFAGDVVKVGAGLLWKGGEAVLDGLTTEQAAPVEESVGNTLPTTPVSEALDDINKARYSAFKRAGSLGNTGPVGPDGTSFSPGRWDAYEKADQVQSSMNDGLMGSLTQALNAKPNLTNAKRVAHGSHIMSDAITSREREAEVSRRGKLTNAQIVAELNRRPNASTISETGYEPYGKPGVVTAFGVPMGQAQDYHRPVYSDKDLNTISLFKSGAELYPEEHQDITKESIYPQSEYPHMYNKSMGLPNNETLTWQEEEARAVGNNPTPMIEQVDAIEPMSLSPDQQNNLVNIVMSVTPQARVAMFGKAAVDYVMKVVQSVGSKYKTPHLNTLANKPVSRADDILTVTEQGMMKPVVRNKTGLGKNTPEELGKININTPIQGENVFTNSQILAKRNQLGPKGTPVNVHLQPTKGTPRDLGAGSFGAKGAAAEDTRNMLRALKTEAKKKGPNVMAADKRRKARAKRKKKGK
ncbi:MAG: hypothetical protein NZ730_09250, partial [Porticoccaceae bacterium]|nr:hypothetical protein [Porticoccaceae bacterium]